MPYQVRFNDLQAVSNQLADVNLTSETAVIHPITLDVVEDWVRQILNDPILAGLIEEIVSARKAGDSVDQLKLEILAYDAQTGRMVVSTIRRAEELAFEYVKRERDHSDRKALGIASPELPDHLAVPAFEPDASFEPRMIFAYLDPKAINRIAQDLLNEALDLAMCGEPIEEPDLLVAPEVVAQPSETSARVRIPQLGSGLSALKAYRERMNKSNPVATVKAKRSFMSVAKKWIESLAASLAKRAKKAAVRMVHNFAEYLQRKLPPVL